MAHAGLSEIHATSLTGKRKYFTWVSSKFWSGLKISRASLKLNYNNIRKPLHSEAGQISGREIRIGNRKNYLAYRMEVIFEVTGKMRATVV